MTLSFLELMVLSILPRRALGPLKIPPLGDSSSPKQKYFVSQKLKIPNHTREYLLCKEKDKWHFLRYLRKYTSKCKAIKHVYTLTSCVRAIFQHHDKPPIEITNSDLFTCFGQMPTSFFKKIPESPVSSPTFFILPGIN